MTELFNTDAEFQIFLENELEVMKTKTYDIVYDDLRAREFLPISRTGSLGDEFISYIQGDYVGDWSIGENGDDIPTVDVSRKKFPQPIVMVNSAYNISDMEALRARKTGLGLQQMRVNAVRRKVEEGINHLATYGDASRDIKGFLQHPSTAITTLTAANPGGGTAWSTKTPEQIKVDVDLMVTTMVTESRGRFSPTDLVLPLEQYLILVNTQLPDYNTNLLNHIIQTSPWIQRIHDWLPCQGAGVGSTDRAIAYRRDESVLSLEMVHEFDMTPLQYDAALMRGRSRGFAATAGVILFQPKGLLYMDGI